MVVPRVIDSALTGPRASRVVTGSPLRRLWPFYAGVWLVGVTHLTEVNVIDARASAWAREVTGLAFDSFARLEAPLARSLDAVHAPPVLAAVTLFYLFGYIALLLGAPALVAAAGDERLLRRTLLSYPVLYAMALPFFLLHPSLNPYVALDLGSPFAPLHPAFETVYYVLTTRDNTFPSMHVGFTVLLLVRVRSSPALARWHAPLLAHGALLIASVVYLRVHWVGDVAGGLVAALAAVRLTDWLDARLAARASRAAPAAPSSPAAERE